MITKTAEIIKKAEILRDLGPIATYNVEQLKDNVDRMWPPSPRRMCLSA